MHLLKITTSIWLLLLLCPLAVQAEEHQELPFELFDGKSKRLVVNGYSTSFHWPALLIRKLNRYFDGKSPITVVSATQGGTPIAKWMDIETGKPLTPWTSKLRPVLSQQDSQTVVLAQQSLQWAYGDRSSGIRNASDKQRIEAGSQVLKQYAELLLADGADAVILATHIYKKGMEPQIGNERYALKELMKQSPHHIFAGPDVWEPTSKVWPQAFQADQLHPNSIGSEIMAHYWFVTLLQLDGRAVPDWSEQEMKAAIVKGATTSPTQEKSPSNLSNFLIRRMRGYDKNNDGKVTKSEYQGPPRAFSRFDTNSDGVITTEELKMRN